MSVAIPIPYEPIPESVASRPVVVSAAVTTRERLPALDAFRGLTVAAMLLVNNPGSSESAYPALKHAVWHGWTPTDLVFPFFLFIVGITTHLSLSARAEHGEDDDAIRRQILRRGALIFLIGLLLNAFPFYQYGSIAGNASPTFLDHVLARLDHVRILGVLQRIGLAYAAAALLSWRASTRRVVAVVAALLLGYWFAMTLLPVPGEGTIGAVLLDDRSRTLSAWLDRTLLDWTRFGGGNHLWDGTTTYDPEGVLSTLPAIGTALLGVLAGRWIKSEHSLFARINGLYAVGAIALVLGLMWGWSFPINKNIWTSSFVLFSAGTACVVIATVMWISQVQRWRRWTKPFIVYGTNPIIAFVGSELTAQFLQSTIRVRVEGHSMGLRELVYQQLAVGGLAPSLASLAYALAFVGLWYGILLALYRKRIFLKV